MGSYATLSDLILRAGAGDAARAASRDLDAPVTGALLRRAVGLLGPDAGWPPGEAARADMLAELRADGLNVLYAASKATADWTAADFAARSTDGEVTPPEWSRGDRWLAVAVADDQPPPTQIDVGGFDQFSAFEAGGSVSMGGVNYLIWQTTFAWPSRSSGTPLRVRPFAAGSRLWGDDELAALPAALDRVQRALKDASAEIDGWLRGRYPAFDASTPGIALRCVDIAVQTLIQGDKDSPEEMRCRAAVTWLREVSRAETGIDQDPPADGAMAAVSPPRPPAFGGRSLDAYMGPCP